MPWRWKESLKRGRCGAHGWRVRLTGWQGKIRPGGDRIQTAEKYGAWVPAEEALTLGEVCCFKLLTPPFDLGVVENLAQHPAEQPLEAGILKIAQ